jgi:hypothetical protein
VEQARWVTPALAVGAAGATLAAAVTDFAAAEHPTHLVVLVLAAASAFWLRRRGRVGSVQAWRAAFVAAIAQPAAHAYGSMLPPDPAPHDGAHLLHILATDGQSAIVQIGLPAMASLVLVTLAYLVELLVHAVRRAPRGHLLPALPPRRVPAAFSARRGSLPRWCGWVISTARRGPPALMSQAA